MVPIFLHSEISQPAPEDARFHILPVSLERTVSFGSGTAQGPVRLLEASGQLELTDAMFGEPWLHGIFTAETISDQNTDAVFRKMNEAIHLALRCRAMPITLGGEHTVSYGAVIPLAQKLGPIGVINFDAHADLRDHYQDDPFSHACVMRRIFDSGIPIVQIGNRALCAEEYAFINEHSIPFFPAADIVPQNSMTITLPADFPKQVYISIDIDGFDPSLTPATGTPVPGGIAYYQFFQLVTSCLKDRRLIGFDLVEHSPIPGFHAYDLLAADIIYKMMGIAAQNVFQTG